MVDLSTTYGGLKLKNPLVVGAGPTTHTPQICALAAKHGWAGVVLKTFNPSDMHHHLPLNLVPRPFYALTDACGVEIWRPTPAAGAGRQTRGGAKKGKIPEDYSLIMNFPVDRSGCLVGPGNYYPDPEGYLNYINKTKERCEKYDCKVIASITGFGERGFDEGIDIINQSKADGVELMLSCAFAGALHPDTGEWYSGGQAVYPKNVEKFTRYCGERIRKDISVFVKLPPHCPDTVGSAKAAQENGAGAIQYADGDLFRYYPIRPVLLDIETQEVGIFPGFPHAVGMGRFALPYIMGALTLMRTKGITIDIAGCGGIRNYTDIIRLLMCGATSVQVVTAAMVEGLAVAEEWLEEITKWLGSKGRKGIREIIGVAADKSKLRMNRSKLPPIEVPQVMGGPTPRVMVEMNAEKCVQCGWCAQCCFHMAIKMEGRGPIINQKLCEVCGMCVALCPTQSLSIVPRPGEAT